MQSIKLCVLRKDQGNVMVKYYHAYMVTLLLEYHNDD